MRIASVFSIVIKDVVMNDLNQIQEKNTAEQNDSLLDSNARRKMIKGTAIALPVVMTLRSGAAMASASTESCIARDQRLADDQNPNKFTNSDTDPFLRTETTITKLIKVKEEKDVDGQNPKWVYDKKNTVNGNGTFFKYRTVYAHGQGLSTLPTEWLNTSLSSQSKFSIQTDSVVVYDEYADEQPAINGTNYFKQGANNYFVQDTSFGSNGTKDKNGLVLTHPNGDIQTDELGGPRVGRSVNHGDVQDNNHITGSCWSSLNPMVP